MKKIQILSVLFLAVLAFSSCTVNVRTMKQPNAVLELKMEDFELSKQVTGEASQVKIFFIDWARLFGWKSGDIGSAQGGSIPIISSLASSNPMTLKKVDMYAVYNLLQDNPGYDIVMYPQYEKNIVNLIIIKRSKVKVTARLAKLK